LGLTKAISSMFVNIEGASKIKFDLRIDNVDNLFDKEKEINIYRIVQECVNNIIKHSAATNAMVIVRNSVSHLMIEIADNGKGFDFEFMKSESKGFGLKNMANRISFLDGEIAYCSSIDFATIVKIKIPVRSEQ
jgi:signal transduction histidine kinase